MKKAITIIALIILCVQNLGAQTIDTLYVDENDIRTTYRFKQKWSIEPQAGINYLAAENTRYVSMSRNINVAAALSVGKRFSPLWGSRLRLIWGRSNGVYDNRNANSPLFHFQYAGAYIDGALNFTNLIRGVHTLSQDNKRWNLDMLLGIGMVHTGNYELSPERLNYKYLEPKSRLNFGVYGGTNLSYRVAKNLDITFELGISAYRDMYNGQMSKTDDDMHFDLSSTAMFGVRYTFPERKKMPKKLPVIVNIEETFEPEVVEEIIPAPIIVEKVVTDTVTVYVKPQERKIEIDTLKMIHFDFDKSNIKPEYALYLDTIATLMQDNPDLEMLIMGHCDYYGSVKYNYGLSYRRATSVMSYLKKKGIPYNRMFFSFYSKLIPYTNDRSDDGRAINRRVQVRVMPKKELIEFRKKLENQE